MSEEIEVTEEVPADPRVAPDLGAHVRLYQADDAADAPGAWYVVVHHDGKIDADVRLGDADQAIVHELAVRLLGAK